MSQWKWPESPQRKMQGILFSPDWILNWPSGPSTVIDEGHALTSLISYLDVELKPRRNKCMNMVVGDTVPEIYPSIWCIYNGPTKTASSSRGSSCNLPTLPSLTWFPLGSSPWFFILVLYPGSWVVILGSLLNPRLVLYLGSPPPAPVCYVTHPCRLPFTNYASAVPTSCLQWPPSIAVDPVCRGHCSCHPTYQTYPVYKSVISIYFHYQTYPTISLAFQGPFDPALAPTFLFYQTHPI